MYNQAPKSTGHEIEFQGEQYKDSLLARATFNIPFGQRLLNLFRPTMDIEMKIYFKEVVPMHKAVTSFRFISYLDKLKWKYNRLVGDTGYQLVNDPSVAPVEAN